MPLRRHSQSPPRMRESATRSSYVHASGGQSRERSFSRTLPPLDFGSRPYGSMSPTSPSSYYMPKTTRSAPSAIPSFDVPKQASSSHPESPFMHHPELPSPQEGPKRFASHSSGQWDNASQSSTWSRPSTAYSTGAESPVVRRPQDVPRPSPISRRFDPVYDSVSVNQARGYSPAASPADQTDAVHDEDAAPATQ